MDSIDQNKFVEQPKQLTPDQIYEIRKAAIKTPDSVLIARNVKESQGFQDSVVGQAQLVIEKKKDFLRARIGNPNLYDIGGGKGGLSVALGIIGSDAGINHVTLVDPYAKEGDVFRSGNKEKYKDQFKLVSQDGLSFLLDQNTSPANVMTCSVDADVIGNYEYIERLAQEIYRIVPENGVFISLNSKEIEDEATRLFPFVQEFSGVRVFSKRELLDRDLVLSNFKNFQAKAAHLLQQYRPNVLSDRRAGRTGLNITASISGITAGGTLDPENNNRLWKLIADLNFRIENYRHKWRQAEIEEVEEFITEVENFIKDNHLNIKPNLSNWQ